MTHTDKDADLIKEAQAADESNSFVRGCAAKFENFGYLTDNQRKALEKVIEEAWEMGEW